MNVFTAKAQSGKYAAIEKETGISLEKIPLNHPFEPARLCEACENGKILYATIPNYDVFTLPGYNPEDKSFYYQNRKKGEEKVLEFSVRLQDFIRTGMDNGEAGLAIVSEYSRLLGVPQEDIDQCLQILYEEAEAEKAQEEEVLE